MAAPPRQTPRHARSAPVTFGMLTPDGPNLVRQEHGPSFGRHYVRAFEGEERHDAGGRIICGVD
jgi:hypothetical protein